MNERQRFIARAALIYLTSNLTDANQAFEIASPHNVIDDEPKIIGVCDDNGECTEGEAIGETEINDLLIDLTHS